MNHLGSDSQSWHLVLQVTICLLFCSNNFGGWETSWQMRPLWFLTCFCSKIWEPEPRSRFMVGIGESKGVEHEFLLEKWGMLRVKYVMFLVLFQDVWWCMYTKKHVTLRCVALPDWHHMYYNICIYIYTYIYIYTWLYKCMSLIRCTYADLLPPLRPGRLRTGPWQPALRGGGELWTTQGLGRRGECGGAWGDEHRCPAVLFAGRNAGWRSASLFPNSFCCLVSKDISNGFNLSCCCFKPIWLKIQVDSRFPMDPGPLCFKFPLASASSPFGPPCCLDRKGAGKLCHVTIFCDCREGFRKSWAYWLLGLRGAWGSQFAQDFSRPSV